MRALITGISGFVGRHLTARLCSLGATVAGIDRLPGRGPAGAELFIGDAGDRKFVSSVAESTRPTHVFHLAGAIAATAGDPSNVFASNVLGTVSLFEALRETPCTVLIASSSAVYGAGGHDPVSEQAPVEPITAYGASKAAQEVVAAHYRRAHNMAVITTRTFNLVGPGQPAALMASSVARQIAEAEAGSLRRIHVGNLTSSRDYVDVRDAVRAYIALAERSESGQVYNVCSGRACQGRHIVDLLLKEAAVPIDVHVDDSRLRSCDVPFQVGDPSRIREAVGWTPTIDLQESLRDLMGWWRGVLRVGGGVVQ